MSKFNIESEIESQESRQGHPWHKKKPCCEKRKQSPTCRKALQIRDSSVLRGYVCHRLIPMTRYESLS